MSTRGEPNLPVGATTDETPTSSPTPASLARAEGVQDDQRSQHGWKLVAGGAGIVGAVVVITTATGELGSESAWALMMGLLIIGVLLVVGGIGTIAAHRIGR